MDLNAIVEVADGKPSARLLERLSSDSVLLVDVLYTVCRPECERRGVSDEDFGAAMADGAVEQATDALLDEVIDFSPRRSARRFVGSCPPAAASGRLRGEGWRRCWRTGNSRKGWSPSWSG